MTGLCSTLTTCPACPPSSWLRHGSGGGGYRLSSFAAFDNFGASVDGRDAVAAFAWQAGTGVFWNGSDRIALDLCYRLLGMNQRNAALLYDGPYFNGTDVVNVTNQPYGTLRTSFSAREVLVSIRIYELFRRRPSPLVRGGAPKVTQAT